MCFRRRLIVIAVLAATAVALYSASSYYSVSMISYVVEQALLQKLPPGADAKTVQSRLRTSLAVLPDREAKLKKLLERFDMRQTWVILPRPLAVI